MDDTHRRMAALESQNRIFRLVLVVMLVHLAMSAWMPRSQARQSNDPLRVRGLIVEDANGRARIVLGSVDPKPSPRGVGLRINDTNGVERFGLTLNERGAVVMGFDAPPGTGDDRNRERINLVADEKGGAYVRMKDRRTGVVSSWYLDDSNQAWMEFSDYFQKPATRRRFGLKGEETVTGAP